MCVRAGNDLWGHVWLTSKYPPLLTKGREQINMVISKRRMGHPVIYADAPTHPIPALVVNKISTDVRLLCGIVCCL